MMRRLALYCLAGALGAALLAPPAAAQMTSSTPRDPLEPVNRAVFTFNRVVEHAVLRPVAQAFRPLPPGLRRGVDNFFSNLREPVVVIASALQGDGRNATASAGRFLVNSTAGIVGVFDVATPMGMVSRPEDMGLTLCRYGIGHGPYLVLPFVGSSSGRDVLGLGAVYAATFGLFGGATLPYLAVDGTVSYAVDASIIEEALPDIYVLEREAYIETRALACDGLLGPHELKASPFGQVRLRLPSLDDGPDSPAEAPVTDRDEGDSPT